MYAKLILTSDGKKEYHPITGYDEALYRKAVTDLEESPYGIPRGSIEPGYNTNQVLNYGFTSWHQMFNARQLLCISTLANRIKEIDDLQLRDAFACLFSGVLEFNNMFASYKGEGTGAVRHMFYHHILKPERTPLEANIWGTPKSSGAFSTLFRSRLLRAAQYARRPFELALSPDESGQRSVKVDGINEPLVGITNSESYEQFGVRTPSSTSHAETRQPRTCRTSAWTWLSQIHLLRQRTLLPIGRLLLRLAKTDSRWFSQPSGGHHPLEVGGAKFGRQGIHKAIDPCITGERPGSEG